MGVFIWHEFSTNMNWMVIKTIQIVDVTNKNMLVSFDIGTNITGPSTLFQWKSIQILVYQKYQIISQVIISKSNYFNDVDDICSNNSQK